MKKYKKVNLILIFIISVIISSCSSSQPKPVSFTIVTQGGNSGYTKKQRIVVKNKADFENMWQNLYINFSDKPAVPDVDFTKQTVIGVFFGEYMSGGSSIGVKSVNANDEGIIVTVEEITPGSNCVTTDVITQPYQIISIPKAISPVKFVTINTVRNCN